MPTGLLRATVARADEALPVAAQITGEITMTVKKPKATARKEWRPQLEQLAKDYPLAPYTDARPES